MKINKIDEAVLIGLIVGDGYLSKDNKIRISHCINQKDYCIFKAKLLHSVTGGDPIKVHEETAKYTYWENGEKIKKSVPVIRIQKGSKSFNYLRDLIYPNGKKYFSLELLTKMNTTSIMLWWLDDGNIDIHKSGNGYYCASLRWSTYVTKEEADVIIKYFKDTWNINWNARIPDKRTDKYCLFCGKEEGIKFLNIFKDFVIENIPSMSYKVIDLEHECRTLNAKI